MSFESAQRAIRAVARGELVVVADDDDRENEGDLIVAASAVTPEKVAFMVRHTSGVICVAARASRLEALELPLMVPRNEDSNQTAFTVSVDLRHGTSTGISSADRSATIRALAEPRTRASDLSRPGHVFPLRARAGGVLERPGHTEAASDLAELSRLAPLGALAEIVNDDGSMARRPELVSFARQHGLAYVTIGELVAYRRWLGNRHCDSAVSPAAPAWERSRTNDGVRSTLLEEASVSARPRHSARVLHDAALSLEIP